MTFFDRHEKNKRKQQNMAINFNYNYPQVAREAGFQLRQYKDGPLDWRLMGSMEIERILRDQSLEQVDAVLTHLSEAPLSSMLETNILDSGIAKYFVLSQFSIQYLLFCRTFLDETVAELRESYAASQLEVAQLKKSLGEANNEILQLHKKMTHMEAIHEVIFPCHLCTKNFVNNEALNIHLNRKHGGKATASSGGGGSDGGRSRETPTSAQKDKDHDLNLINTIKLELEIKQLKERLNIAEKDIKERASKGATPRSQARNRDRALKSTGSEVRSVGIQSNLIESKEQDESSSISEDGTKTADIPSEQLTQLVEQVKNFEEWRQTLSENNQESIAEINRKLADITHVLEHTKELKVQDQQTRQATNGDAMQEKMSASVENLERLLSEKVLEIGKVSVQKLEEVVSSMETNYKYKLEALEREIKQNLRDHKLTSEAKHEQTGKLIPVLPMQQNTRSGTETSDSDEEANVPQKDETLKQSQNANNTYVIKPKNAESSEILQDILKAKKMASLSSESNHTFTKVKEYSAKALNQSEVSDENTDVSDTLSEDETDKEPELKQKTIVLEREEDVAKSKTETKERKTNKERQRKPNKESTKDKPVKPKPVTRKDIRKLVDKRLSSFGVNLKTKSLSNTSVKRTSEELTERREKQKQKYVNFYVTRNKIKKFVDKLCSTKLPSSAEHMLNSTFVLQPIEGPRKQQQKHYDLTVIEHSFNNDQPNASTPKKTPQQVEAITTADGFKERLERILASPMQCPNSKESLEIMVTADVHGRSKGMPRPVPVPRKRVMFNTKHENETNE